MRAIVTVVATAVAVAVAPPADAARRPRLSCPLIKDAAGDVSRKFEGQEVFPEDAGLDILSADVVSDATRVTAVIRLASDPGVAVAYGKRYLVKVDVRGLANPLVLAAAVTPTGHTFSFGYHGPSPTTGAVSYNYSTTAAIGKIEDKAVTVSAALIDIASMEQLGLITKGAKFSSPTAISFRRVPSAAQVFGSVIAADEAASSKTYVARAASCIKTYSG